MKKSILAIIAVAAIVVVAAVAVLTRNSDKKASLLLKNGAKEPVMVLLYSPTCPHCQKAIKFLDKVEKSKGYPELRIYKYDVSTQEGGPKYYALTKEWGLKADGAVPVALFGDGTSELGFDEEYNSGEGYRQHIAATIAAAKASK